MTKERQRRGAFLRGARRARGFSQREVAAAVLESGRLQTVSDWERGNGEPNAAQLTALGAMLGFSLDDYGAAALQEERTGYGPEPDLESSTVDDPAPVDVVARLDRQAAALDRLDAIHDRMAATVARILGSAP